MKTAGGESTRFLVQKFGGTSVGTLERIRNAAARACEARRSGYDVVVVVSAMAGETDRLLGLARDLLPIGSAAERDVVAASGEQVTAGLTALAIQSLGGKARSFLGHQLPILTDETYADADLLSAGTGPLLEAMGKGEIPVVAGFQGVDRAGRLTTLGRGGSDTTAVAIAAALSSAVCEIYTDVDGVYTADPGICPGARKLATLSYDSMLALASLGAKVLHAKSVTLAMSHQVPIHVRSSLVGEEGTWVVAGGERSETGLTGVTNQAEKISLVGNLMHGHPEIRDKFLRVLSERAIASRAVAEGSRYISCRVASSLVHESLRTLHEAFFPKEGVVPG